MKRRKFIKHLGHSMAIPGMIGSLGFASPKSISRLMRTALETERVLVLIYLSGGNDGLNTVIPLKQYHRYPVLRPGIALPESSLKRLGDTDLAVHPSLGFLSDLYSEKRLAVVQSVGYEDQNFSHFRSTDIWMSGSRADEYLSSGWTGRFLNHEFPLYPEGFPNENFTDPLAIEIGRGGSLLFQGPTASMGMTISNPDNFYQLINDEPQNIPDTLAGDKLKHIELISRQSQQYGQVVRNASENVSRQRPYPGNNLANQLKIVARLIAGGLKTPLYMVNLGGFDTHSNQVDKSDPTQGWHATLLDYLDESINAFVMDMEFLGIDDRVLGMTFSEFGRRIISNSSYGTDHGAAAPMFLFGNRVNSSVFGNDPPLPNSRSVKDNVEKQFDLRQVYGSVLEQWFGLDPVEVSSILLDKVETIPVIEDPTFIGLNSDFKDISIFPNPLASQSQIAFRSDGTHTEVFVYNSDGRKVAHLFSGIAAYGKRIISWDTGALQAGSYFVHIRSAGMNITRQVVKY